jgi:hypothetical protein
LRERAARAAAGTVAEPLDEQRRAEIEARAEERKRAREARLAARAAGREAFEVRQWHEAMEQAVDATAGMSHVSAAATTAATAGVRFTSAQQLLRDLLPFAGAVREQLDDTAVSRGCDALHYTFVPSADCRVPRDPRRLRRKRLGRAWVAERRGRRKRVNLRRRNLHRK